MLVCGLSCPALTSSNSRVLPEEHCRRRRRSLSSDKSAAAAAVTSAHSYDDMHSGGPPLHYTVLPPAGMLAQLSPLAVLNNNGFTRKLQVQACYRQLPPPRAPLRELLVPLVQKIKFLKSLLPCLFGIAISGLALVLVVNRQCLAFGLAWTALFQPAATDIFQALLVLSAENKIPLPRMHQYVFNTNGLEILDLLCFSFNHTE